ncbi:MULTISPECIES: YtxH domain-containing protein [Flavobacteriaceae]|uniref:YtxH domain-containing protein n=2 Tax=Flavobacteriaceae TaxID=49546 RepID=A0ABS3EYL8_9FLAO|nr:MULTISPECIES: YtxH domain-containing protein [Allomuricauda]MBO0331217.1 YtxH domain-containing protein [[Muricauda] lutisoli]MBO0342388.1 YtxH domain-containing protein [Allomuricauda profundi]MEC7770906.1 YtxH domain-containing protein [Bacteroidota bacterium]
MSEEEKKDFGDKAEEAAKDFKEDVNKAFDPANPESGKTVAIVAHLTLIGWVIALIMNSSNKTELGSFYIRQTLGIGLLGLVLGLIPVINFIAWIFPLILWIVSLVGAINGNKKPVFLVGEYFQSWFKGL